jgi:hypothetical protein
MMLHTSVNRPLVLGVYTFASCVIEWMKVSINRESPKVLFTLVAALLRRALSECIQCVGN